MTTDDTLTADLQASLDSWTRLRAGGRKVLRDLREHRLCNALALAAAGHPSPQEVAELLDEMVKIHSAIKATADLLVRRGLRLESELPWALRSIADALALAYALPDAPSQTLDEAMAESAGDAAAVSDRLEVDEKKEPWV